jgi:hypothetical protein
MRCFFFYTIEKMERVKGIEPSYSAWKGSNKVFSIKDSSEKLSADLGPKTAIFRTALKVGATPLNNDGLGSGSSTPC